MCLVSLTLQLETDSRVAKNKQSAKAEITNLKMCKISLEYNINFFQSFGCSGYEFNTF